MTDTLRPVGLADYIGQPRLKARLQVMVDAASAGQRPLPHMLLAGPAGSGKTSLAYVIGTLTGDEVHKLTLPVDIKELERLVRYETGIFLLDEVHEASSTMKARLKVLLECGFLPTASGERIHNDFFTIIATTTNTEAIPASLYDRFIVPPFEPYSVEDMGRIVASMAAKAGIEMDDETCAALGHAASGTPRYALKLVEAARQLSEAMFGIPAAVDAILLQAGFAYDGLTEPHLLYLEALIEFDSVGLAVLARHLRLHPTVVMDLERLLLLHHLIEYRSGQGRRLTQAGRRRAVQRHEEEAA